MEKVYKALGIPRGGKMDIVYLVKIALLSAIAYVVFLVEFPIPYFPPFLEIDLSDIVAIIGGVMLGPIAGVLIEVVKNSLRFILFNSGTGGIGEFANLLVGVAYVLPFCIIFKSSTINSLKRFILGSLTGILSMTIIASVANYFILIPVYTGIHNHSEKISMITTLYGPFNIVKGIIITLVGYIAIRAFKPLIHKF